MTEIRQLILLLIILPFAAALVARAQAQAVDSNTPRIPRIALVIGNGDYLNGALLHPAADAKAMADVLRKEHFDVMPPVLDANEAEMIRALQTFEAKLHPGDISLFYFSGHGMQMEGNNYLLPVDIKPGDDVYRIISHSLQANEIAQEIQSKTAGLKIIILDACRKNPFSIANGSPKGLVQMNFPGEGVIAYATAYGDSADDNDKDGEVNSIFTKYLLRFMQEPGMDLKETLWETSNAVSVATNKKQSPHYDFGPMEEFYFLPRAIDAAGTQPAQRVAHPREPAFSTQGVYHHRDYDNRVVPNDGIPYPENGLPHNEKEDIPGTADYYAKKGSAALNYSNGADNAEAERNFRKAVELAPDVASFRSGLAEALFRQEKYAEAEAEEREAIKEPLGGDFKSDMQGFAHNELGEILEGSEKYAEAEAEYKKALEIDKKTGKVWTSTIEQNLRRLHSKMRRTPPR
jgi:caspase domain-containing protein/tetratricopeptide repeat protein